MANSGTEKYLKSFEWNVEIPYERFSAFTSKSFFFKEKKINLKLSSGSYRGYAILYFENNFSTSMKIMLIITGTNLNEIIKIFYTSSGSQEIWRSNTDMRNLSLTFQVIFTTEDIKDTGTASGSQVKVDSYLKENIHFQALSKDFAKLLNVDDESCDVTITCGTKKFHAHKAILQTRSTVLSAMLKSDMSEGKTGLITVKGIKLEIFEHFLRYLYSGNLPELNMDVTKELYKVADQYAVDALKMACSEFMIKNLSEKNACETLVLADLHSDEDFRKQAISYIVEKRIPRRDDNWPAFCKNHCILAVEVLNFYILKHCDH